MTLPIQDDATVMKHLRHSNYTCMRSKQKWHKLPKPFKYTISPVPAHNHQIYTVALYNITNGVLNT